MANERLRMRNDWCGKASGRRESEEGEGAKEREGEREEKEEWEASGKGNPRMLTSEIKEGGREEGLCAVGGGRKKGMRCVWHWQVVF